jgi:hypothetical protein
MVGSMGVQRGNANFGSMPVGRRVFSIDETAGAFTTEKK